MSTKRIYFSYRYVHCLQICYSIYRLTSQLNWRFTLFGVNPIRRLHIQYGRKVFKLFNPTFLGRLYLPNFSRCTHVTRPVGKMNTYFGACNCAIPTFLKKKKKNLFPIKSNRIPSRPIYLAFFWARISFGKSRIICLWLSLFLAVYRRDAADDIHFPFPLLCVLGIEESRGAGDLFRPIRSWWRAIQGIFFLSPFVQRSHETFPAWRRFDKGTVDITLKNP